MLIDSHCHLTEGKYEKSKKQLVEEAAAEGVEKLITIGTSVSSSQEVIADTNEFESVYGVVGIYPHENIDTPISDLRIKLLGMLENNKKIVGIGECGIDIQESMIRDLESQKELFEMQVQLAIEKNLPLVIHNRNGDKEVFEVLQKYAGKVTGVAHCFVSTWETAQKFLDLGFYISFSAIITYKSGVEIHETVLKTPLDRVLVETDAPYLVPNEVRRKVKINEPKYVRMTATEVARIRNLPLNEIEAHTYKNTCELFKI